MINNVGLGVLRFRDAVWGALEVHVGTVKTQLHRAVHRLREELGEHR